MGDGVYPLRTPRILDGGRGVRHNACMVNSAHTRRLLLATLAGMVLAIFGGVCAAWLCRVLDVSSPALALGPALLAGAAVVIVEPHFGRLHVGLCVLAGMAAVLTFSFVGPVEQWQAGELEQQRVDVLAVQSVALRMCFEKHLSVQGYEDVPEPIREQARRRVAAMSLRERRELVRQRFAPALNSTSGDWRSSASLAVWAIAAGALAVTPAGVWSLLRRSD